MIYCIKLAVDYRRNDGPVSIRQAATDQRIVNVKREVARYVAHTEQAHVKGRVRGVKTRRSSVELLSNDACNPQARFDLRVDDLPHVGEAAIRLVRFHCRTVVVPDLGPLVTNLLRDATAHLSLCVDLLDDDALFDLFNEVTYFTIGAHCISFQVVVRSRLPCEPWSSEQLVQPSP